MRMASETMVFLFACLAGVFLGVVYDIFRFCRLIHRDVKTLVFLEDLLFALVASIVTFYFQIHYCSGWLRGFVLLGELLGFLAYHFTLGEITIRLFRLIVRIVSTILRWIWKWIVLLPLHFIVFVLNKIFAPILRIIQKCLKRPRNKKFSLPQAVQMLYNKHNKPERYGKDGDL